MPAAKKMNIAWAGKPTKLTLAVQKPSKTLQLIWYKLHKLYQTCNYFDLNSLSEITAS